MFDPLIQGVITREAKGLGGRPRFDPMLMFKVLVLQRLRGLADDATSFQITDRNSFRAFLGLTPGDAVPDGQTISDFRERLIKMKTFESLFDTFLVHLQKASNREKLRTRSRVEHVFAQMSGSMKALNQRCVGMKRNAACLTLTNLVYNMLRFEQIKRHKLNAAA